MKTDQLQTSDDLLAEDLRDPDFRAKWDQTALARAIAQKLVSYRADHSLSQRKLAEILSMKQPQVARLEGGEVVPTLGTLIRIAERLSIEIALDVCPSDQPPTLMSRRAQADAAVAMYRSGNATIMIAPA